MSLRTTLVQLSENEFRVDDRFTVSDLHIDYRNDFDRKSKLWSPIEIKIGKTTLPTVTVWNRNNYMQLSGYNVDPLLNFESIYVQESENPLVNLILNLDNRRFLHPRYISHVHTIKDFGRAIIENYYETEKLIAVPILNYGWNNTVVALFNSAYGLEDYLKDSHYKTHNNIAIKKYVY